MTAEVTSRNDKVVLNDRQYGVSKKCNIVIFRMSKE